MYPLRPVLQEKAGNSPKLLPTGEQSFRVIYQIQLFGSASCGRLLLHHSTCWQRATVFSEAVPNPLHTLTRRQSLSLTFMRNIVNMTCLAANMFPKAGVQDSITNREIIIANFSLANVGLAEISCLLLR